MAKDNDLKILQINQIIAIRNSVLRMAGTHHNITTPLKLPPINFRSGMVLVQVQLYNKLENNNVLVDLKLGLTKIKYLRFEWHGPIFSDLGLFANIEKFIEGIRKLFRDDIPRKHGVHD